MQVRYTDLNAGSHDISDFAIRRRTPTIIQLLVVLTGVLLVAVFLTLSVESREHVLVLISALMALTGCYTVMVIQRNRDLVLSTEFQNALFASALGINNKFCVIIRKDGSIIYLDRSFQAMFPDFLKQPRRTIDVLLEFGKVRSEEANKIYAAIEQGIYSKVLFEMRVAGNEYHRIVMSIEPIMRPSGYIMLRGRDYVESRAASADSSTAKSLNKSSITLFSHVMDTMNMGVYMTNPSGEIVYVNPVLEQWLGYQDNEINSKNITLGDIFSPQPGMRLLPENYEGEIQLVSKTGSTIKSFLNQKVIRDDQSKIIGCTGLVHNFLEPSTETKKKLW